MSKFRKLMAAAVLLFGASAALVGCSDDDPTMLGPVGINSIVSTATTAYVQWTIVSGDYIDGYKVTLREGGRDGQIVGEVTQLPKETNHTFTNLKPNTVYTVSTQGQVKSGSGFSTADIAYREFMTAPLITTTGVTSEVRMNTEVDDEGNIVQVPRAFVNVKFTQFPAVNCGSYSVNIYEGTASDIEAGLKLPAAQRPKPAKTATISLADGAKGADFWPLNLNTTYTAVTAANANASCWFLGTADNSFYQFTTPAN